MDRDKSKDDPVAGRKDVYNKVSDSKSANFTPRNEEKALHLENSFISLPASDLSRTLNGTSEGESNVASTSRTVNHKGENCTYLQEPSCSNVNKANFIYPTANDDNVVHCNLRLNNLDEADWRNMETQPCQKYKPCHEKIGTGTYDFNLPSTSSTSVCHEHENSPSKENRKRSHPRTRSNVEEDTSSDTGNDDYSLGSEDGCIYTYRGGEHLADLPSSFFSLDMGLPLDNHLPAPPQYVRQEDERAGRNSRASSPDMDFLEMDFDPGPSCEADTSSGSSSADELEVSSPPRTPEVEDNVIVRGTTPDANLAGPSQPSSSHQALFSERLGAVLRPIGENSRLSVAGYRDQNMPSTSRESDMLFEGVTCQPSGRLITHVNARGESLLVRRTMSRWSSIGSAPLHASSGDLVSPREVLDCDMLEEAMWSSTSNYRIVRGDGQTDKVNLSSALYHCTMAKKLMVEKPNADFIEESDSSNLACEGGDEESGEAIEAGVTEVGRCMIWSEREACERQVTQIGTSACGATAVINVFLALGVPIDTDRISNAVGTRQRANNAPLPRYLLSRAVAGCTAAGLISGLQQGSDGLVTARFFPTCPERVVSLSHWLADWISLGAVPIATLNLQVNTEPEVPDAWHHQMIFGVSSRGIYLCNPVVCVRENALWPQLCSPSTLLVRSRDVINRFNSRTDLRPLITVPDHRFATYNVLGQVVNVIREWQASGRSEVSIRTRHIRIPAAYQAGVTVAALTGSEAHKRLMRAQQLPILVPQT